MKKYTTQVTVDKHATTSTESEWPYKAIGVAERTIMQELYKKAGLYSKGKGVHTIKEGDAITIDLNLKVVVRCLVNRRAPKRAPEIIAAEKALGSIAHQKRVAQQTEADMRQEVIKKHRRARIKNQIDYAFKSGSEKGSESVSKYLTCQECDAPADALQLSQVVPTGAAVLNEDSVVGAVCKEHNYSNSPNQWVRQRGIAQGIAEHFPLARLEFFYSGIRQIGIRGKK
jgi:hypothetical protein